MTGPHPDAGRLHDFADRRLSDPERRDLAAHLETCGDCRREVAGLEAQRARLQGAHPNRDVPADLKALIQRSLDSATTSDDVRRRPLVSRRRLLATAATVAIVGGGAWWARNLGRRSAAEQAVDDFTAVEDGRLALARLTSESAALEAFFRDSSVPVRVLDLSAMSYQLEGGTISSTSGVRTAVYVYRGAAAQRVMCRMFAGRLDELPVADRTHATTSFVFRLYRVGGVTVVFWQEGAILCALASRLPENDALDLAVAKAMA